MLNVLDDVKNKLVVLTPSSGGWKKSAIRRRARAGHHRRRRGRQRRQRRRVADGHRLPDPDHADAGRSGQGRQRRSAEDHAGVLRWRRRTWSSSTSPPRRTAPRCPTSWCGPKDLKYDGSAPTLLYGYGGFEISLTPGYSGGVGKGWLEKGGVYVVANIRGGGEYGPRWHQAALKQNRHKAYEDFAAVAQDLVARKITSRQAPGHPGRQQRRPADRQHADPVPGAVRRGGGAGAAAGHEALQPPAGRRVVDGRVRQSGHGRLGLHPDVLAVPPVRPGQDLSADAVHHLHARRPRAPGPRAQDDGEDAGGGQGRALLREHRGRPRRRGQQRAGRAHERAGLHVPVATAGANKAMPQRMPPHPGCRRDRSLQAVSNPHCFTAKRTYPHETDFLPVRGCPPDDHVFQFRPRARRHRRRTWRGNRTK